MGWAWLPSGWAYALPGHTTAHLCENHRLGPNEFISIDWFPSMNFNSVKSLKLLHVVLIFLFSTTSYVLSSVVLKPYITRNGTKQFSGLQSPCPVWIEWCPPNPSSLHGSTPLQVPSCCSDVSPQTPSDQTRSRCTHSPLAWLWRNRTQGDLVRTACW